MIKVNLLRNISAAAGSGPAAPSAGSLGQTDAVVKQLAAAKFVVILLPAFILMGIEKYNTTILTQKLQRSTEQIAGVEKEIKAFGETGPLLDKYTAIKNKLFKKFDALQIIGTNRLREVKTLDSLQTLIPARNWINDLSIDENGKVSLNGYSETSDGAFSFVKAVEENSNFSDVTGIKVSTDDAVKVGTRPEGLRKFSFEFHIGKTK